LLLGHLGDGMAFSIENGVGEVASWPENGEFANETFFVTANDAIKRLRLSAEVLETLAVPTWFVIRGFGE